MSEHQPEAPAVPGVTRWRKRPVEIEAIYWDGDPATATVIIDWILANGGTARYHDDLGALSIDTIEGTMTAVPGDWVIRGVVGEFYPCRKDVFAATYEPAGEPLVLPPDEFAALKSALEHAQAALAGDNEGVRLWMLDCGELVRKHRARAEAAEAKLEAQREYDTYRRALWVMVRQFGGSVFLTSAQIEEVPLLASLGCGREPGGLRINAGEEP